MGSSDGKTIRGLNQVLSSVVDGLTGEGFWPTLLRSILIPIGIGVLTYAVIDYSFEPYWKAPGWPYFNQYGKNVEMAAFYGAFVATVATSLLARIRALYLIVLPFGLSGLLIALLNIHVPLSALIPTGMFLFLVTALFLCLWEKEAYLLSHEKEGANWWVHVLCLLAIVPLAFVLNQKFMTWVDTFHHGSLLYSSLNLFKGNVPFETFTLKHGLHDSGTGALWIGLTDKIGSSTLMLTHATKVALSAAAFYLLCVLIIGSARVAFASTLIIIVVEYLFKFGPEAALEDTLRMFSVLQPPGSFQQWLFVIAGFCVLTSRFRLRHFVAGFFAGFSHLWRFEVGVYGFLALGGVLVYQVMVASHPEGQTRAERVGRLVRYGALYVAGASSLFVLAYLILGWPDAHWLGVMANKYVPHYSDLEGLPFPTVPSPDPTVQDRFSVIAYGQLILVITLVVLSIRVVLRAFSPRWAEASRPRDPVPPHNGEALIFLALIGSFGVKTMLSRSDVAHILHSTPVLVVGVVLVLVASARRWFGWRYVATLGVLLASLFLVIPHTGEIRSSLPPFSSRSPVQSLKILQEHLSPNPPVGECFDRMFTPSETRFDEIQEFIEATCDVETIFKDQGVRSLMIAGSAKWYYVRFGILPENWLYSYLYLWVYPDAHLKLIEHLRERNRWALIRAKNFRARENIDGVPSSITTPVLEAYLQERGKGVQTVDTEIGRLYLFDNPLYRLPTPPSAPFRPIPQSKDQTGIHLVVDELLRSPAGFLVGRGWGIEWEGAWELSRPLKRLFLYSGESLVGEIDYGTERSDVAKALNNPALARAGWKFELVVPALEQGSQDLGVRALTLDDRLVDLRLDTSSMRSLPQLRGRAWDSLPEAVGRARRMAQEAKFPGRVEN